MRGGLICLNGSRYATSAIASCRQNDKSNAGDCRQTSTASPARASGSAAALRMRRTARRRGGGRFDFCCRRGDVFNVPAPSATSPIMTGFCASARNVRARERRGMMSRIHLPASRRSRQRNRDARLAVANCVGGWKEIICGPASQNRLMFRETSSRIAILFTAPDARKTMDDTISEAAIQEG